jgi:hypothetical protein
LELGEKVPTAVISTFNDQLREVASDAQILVSGHVE